MRIVFDWVLVNPYRLPVKKRWFSDCEHRERAPPIITVYFNKHPSGSAEAFVSELVDSISHEVAHALEPWWFWRKNRTCRMGNVPDRFGLAARWARE